MLRSHILTDATATVEETTTTVEEAATATAEEITRALDAAYQTLDDATLHTQHEARRWTGGKTQGTNS